MIFEKESLSFNILEVMKLNQENVNMWNAGRNFGALSFRIHADTRLKTSSSEFCVKDDFIVYVPPRLDYTRISRKDELIVVHFDTIDYQTQNIEFFKTQNPKKLSKLFQEILNCWDKKEIGYKLKCSAILYEIFAECYSQNFQSKAPDSKIRNSVEYIYENYKRSDLTLREIAQRSYMSEVYFRKLFKKEYGISPQKFIVNLRIQNAVNLIAAGYYSLKEIADMSGYKDYHYFSFEFKKKTGITPSKYLYDYHK